MAKISLIGIAETPEDLERGLQFVKALDSMSGMLFSFASPRILNFWMQNTYIPLEIAFLDADNMVVKTSTMIPLSLRTVSSGRPCKMAIEVPFGTLAKAGIEVGKKIFIDRQAKTAEVSK